MMLRDERRFRSVGVLVSGLLSCLLWTGCSVSQYDYPVAAGEFAGTATSGDAEAGTVLIEVSRSTRIESITITLDATDTDPAALVSFGGPVTIEGFEARTFTASVVLNDVTWDLTGSFSVQPGLEIDAEATLATGELTSSTGGSWHLDAIFDADGGNGDPLE